MYAVTIENLTRKFGKTIAIDNLSLTVKKGKITGLIGADGAGKTTLLRTMIGLLLPSEGTINVLGFDPESQKDELNPHIGYMPQKFGLYEDLTVIENLKLFSKLKGLESCRDKKESHSDLGNMDRIEHMLEFTRLTPFKKRLAGALSGGMKQKLGLACTLLGKPELLILDEPSVGVDPISRTDLIEMVRQMITPQTTVIWSTAYLDEAHEFDDIAVMDHGSIIYYGKPYDLGSTPEEFENKVIDLMGGYKKEDSQIAENYVYKATEIDLTVEADCLEKRYGDFFAVKNNTFKIRKGEIFGLLGPNGAGKSTSFKMMCGLARPTGGTARIMGIDITKHPEKARANIGYMAQKFSLYGSLTIRENLEFFAQIYGNAKKEIPQKVSEVIEVFGLKDHENTKAEELPLGLKQRLSMAAALIHNPPILFLDEPTSGVDVITRRDFWNHITSLSKKGVTILVTTHFMDEAEYCDRISLFYKGQTIAIGTPEELKRQAEAPDMKTAFVRLISNSQL